MAKFVWLFALLCIQFSRGEDVLETDSLSGAADNVIQVPATSNSELPGEKRKKSGVDSEDVWTEEDEKWFEEIQSLLDGDSDEDYDEDYVEFGKLLSDIEELMKEHYPEKGDYQWLEEIEKWFMDEENDDDYDENDRESNEKLDDFYYSWLYGKNAKNGERPLQKRFSSV